MRMGGGSDENTHIVGVARHKCDLIAWRHQFVRVTKLAYAVRRPRSAIGKYAFQLSAMLKTEAARSRKQRRTLKQIHEDLRELGFEGSYDRVAAFARVWREGQTERVNPSSKRTIR